MFWNKFYIENPLKYVLIDHWQGLSGLPEYHPNSQWPAWKLNGLLIWQKNIIKKFKWNSLIIYCIAIAGADPEHLFGGWGREGNPTWKSGNWRLASNRSRYSTFTVVKQLKLHNKFDSMDLLTTKSQNNFVEMNYFPVPSRLT